MNTDSQKQSDTLFGGAFNVIHEDGTGEEIKVRQLRMFEYERALPFLKDEFALTAFCCLRTSLTTPAIGTKEWILGIAPEHKDAVNPQSYEELRLAVREVNEKGFFSFAARHEEEDRKAKQEIVRSMAEMPPETLRAVSEMANSGIASFIAQAAADTEMTFDEALGHSYERLMLMWEAKKRSRAKLVLDLAQAIVAGWGDKDAWADKQKRLIDELKTGL